MIKKLINNLTIKSKLNLVIMLTCITALLISGITLITWNHFSSRRSLAKAIEIQAEIIASNSYSAVTLNNKEDAQNILKALQAQPSIIHACIHNANNELLSEYHWDKSHKENHKEHHRILPQKDGMNFSDNELSVVKNIVYNNSRIGTVVIQSDLSPLRSSFINNISIVIATIIIACMLGYLISSNLQKIVSKPLLNLADIAKDISEKQEYDLRATKISNDEIGLLIDAFNDMLEQIQYRDEKLKNINENQDATIQKRTTDLLIANKKQEELNNELKETINRLTGANKELADFAHIAAHDLKAPLRAIGSLSGIIIEDYSDKLDAKGKDYLNKLMQRTERMSELISGILRYSETGKSKINIENVNINKVVKDVITSSTLPTDAQIRIKGILPTISVDKTSIVQILQNLISNAIKYNDKPEPIVKIECTEVNDCWQFCVEDNGPGIEEKYFKKIFEMFQTLARRDEIESTGIGLAIVKKIVESYNGQVWIESEFGYGCKFYFTIPVSNKGAQRHEKLQTNTIS